MTVPHTLILMIVGALWILADQSIAETARAARWNWWKESLLLWLSFSFFFCVGVAVNILFCGGIE